MIQLDVSQYVPRSGLYLDVVTSLVNQTNTEKLAATFEENLAVMQDDVVAFGNVLAEVLATGEFREAEADLSYRGESITFTLRSNLGHWISITFNVVGQHEFYMGYNNNHIELHDVTLETIVAGLRNYNKLQVVTATGEQLSNSYLQQQVRENE